MTSNRFAEHWPAGSLLLAAVMWGLFWLPLRYFHQQGIDGLWSSVIVYLAALVAGVGLMRHHWHELRNTPWRLVAIAFASGWCNISFIVAVAEKDAARVVLLFYLAPVWSIMLGILFLHERPGLSALVISLLAITGAGLMLWDPQQGAVWPRDRNDWLALSSGFSFAVANVLVRGLPQAGAMTKSFVTWCGVVLVGGVGVLLLYHPQHYPVPQIPLSLWPWLLLVGAPGVVVMTVLVQYGVSRLPVYRSAVILLFEVFVTLLSSQLLSDERLSSMGWLGGALIIAASAVSALAAKTSRYRRGRGEVE